VIWHTEVVSNRGGSAPSSPSDLPAPATAHSSEAERIQKDVAIFVAAGANESVQRVITAVHGLSRRLNQWYDRQLADLDLTAGDWAVMSKLARDGGEFGLSPSVLADAANVAPSSMTHRLDRMAKRGLVSRETDPDNRVRVRVQLSQEGWELFRTAIQESDMLESDVLSPLSKGDRVRLAELLEMTIDGLDTVDASPPS
jgi:DNA-binding MarR family transcriptional regulator